MVGNYPAGVTDNDPHFDVPSVEDDPFAPPFVKRGENPWERGEPTSRVSPHDPDCKCDECECPF